VSEVPVFGKTAQWPPLTGHYEQKRKIGIFQEKGRNDIGTAPRLISRSRDPKNGGGKG